MEEFFIWLINTSIVSGIVILAVLVLRPITKKMPKWVNLVLWFIVAVRLIMPGELQSRFSLIPNLDGIQEEYSGLLTKEADEENPIEDIDFESKLEAEEIVENDDISDDGFLFEDSYDEESKLIDFSKVETDEEMAGSGSGLLHIFFIIWLVGCIGMFLYLVISFFRLLHKVKISVPYAGNLELKTLSKVPVYVCENIQTPFIMGLIRTKIYIPENMDDETLKFVIKHENEHIRHFDQFLKLTGFLFLMFYWFNPLVWVAFICFSKDLEMACDERAVIKMMPEDRAAYSMAMLSCSVHDKPFSVCPVAFGETCVKSRIKAVLRAKKPLKIVVALGFAGCLIFAVCFLTNPVEAKNNEDEVLDFPSIDNPDEKTDVVKALYELKQKESKTEELKPEDIKPEDIKPVEVYQKKLKSEDTKQEDQNQKELKTGDSKAEDIKPVDIKPEEQISEELIESTDNTENTDKNEDIRQDNDNKKVKSSGEKSKSDSSKEKNNDSKNESGKNKTKKDDKTPTLENAVIPNGLKKIRDYAFSKTQSIKTVTIPDSVEEIGKAAFDECSSLEKVFMTNSVSVIGDNAFTFCNSLTTIKMSKKITSIGQYAFGFCTSLKSIKLPVTLKNIGVGAFNYTAIREISVPSGVEVIKSSVFTHCQNLERVYLAEGVTAIEDYAFSECTNLTYIEIPDSVKKIGKYAFQKCPNLSEECKDKIKSINKKAKFGKK